MLTFDAGVIGRRKRSTLCLASQLGSAIEVARFIAKGGKNSRFNAQDDGTIDYAIEGEILR